MNEDKLWWHDFSVGPSFSAFSSTFIAQKCSKSQKIDHTSGVLDLEAGFLLTKCPIRSGPARNWPYKRVELTSVDHTSGRDCTYNPLPYLLCANVHLLHLVFSALTSTLRDKTDHQPHSLRQKRSGLTWRKGTSFIPSFLPFSSEELKRCFSSLSLWRRKKEE